ncbi:MAG: amidohydrolase family protein [Deltaproteobacteria bacterium]|nr:amidohydrolase family protein [Deltaproteobacteria bacterium]
MKIDIHTHIFPKEICDNREKFFIGEPAFKLLYESPMSKLVTAEDLISMMDEEGIDLSVTFGFPWKNKDFYKLNNDYIIDVTRKHKDKIKGFGCFDTEDKGVYDETIRCLESGLSGIGELAFYQSGIDEDALIQLVPVMEVCLSKNVPVMIHTNEPVGHNYPGKTPITQKQIYNLAKRFPDNKIVLCHYGGGIFFYNLLKKEVKETLKNIYYDTAASPFLYGEDIYQVTYDLAGSDKLILGTDYPLLKPSRYIKDMDKASLPEGIKEAICYKNAARLLNLL